MENTAKPYFFLLGANVEHLTANLWADFGQGWGLWDILTQRALPARLSSEVLGL